MGPFMEEWLIACILGQNSYICINTAAFLKSGSAETPPAFFFARIINRRRDDTMSERK